MPRRPPFSEADLRAAIVAAACWIDAIRFLGYSPKGSNYKTVKKYAVRWNISTDHFDPHAGRRRASRGRQMPLQDALVEHSPYPRGKLKDRLLAAGIKRPECELCGQGENWHGRSMSLILDHINGVSDDHRLENLRIVCPNCAATFETHCGRNLPRKRTCAACGGAFVPKYMQHRYCSQECWGKVASQLYLGGHHPRQRKVPRPPYEQLLEDLKTMSYCAIGHKYGVSDNAVRKWLRWYEYEREAREAEVREASAEDPPDTIAA
jgi:hypothetical protein